MHNLRVGVRAGALERDVAAAIEADFSHQYRKLYSREPSGGEIEVISWRVKTVGADPGLSIRSLVTRRLLPQRCRNSWEKLRTVRPNAGLIS